MKNNRALIIVLLILVCLLIIFFIVRRSGSLPVAPPQPAPVSTGDSSLFAPEPTGEEAPRFEYVFTISAEVSFKDGTKPESFTGPSSDTKTYRYSNMSMTVTLQGKTKSFPVIVREKDGKFYLGSTVILKEQVADFPKVDKIVFKAPGYRDVEFTDVTIGEVKYPDVPVPNKIVSLPPVVMEK